MLQSPRPLQSTEPPVMIYDTVKTKPATTKVVAKASYSTLSPKLAKLYKKYQVVVLTYLLITH